MKNNILKTNYFQLYTQFLLRTLKARYKQTFAGFGWAVMQPLMMMVVFTVVFGKFAKISSDGIPYPIFSYTALLPWTLLSTGINYGVNSLVSNVSVITKVYFPREIIPLASISAAIVDYFVAATIFIGLLFWYKVAVSIEILLIIPLLLLQLLVMIAIVLVLSVWNIRYRDVRHGLHFMVQLWMYASPVIYPISAVPEKWRFYYMLNPMAGIINGYRTLILKGGIPDITTLLPAVIFALIGLPIGYMYFKKAERSFADII